MRVSNSSRRSALRRRLGAAAVTVVFALLLLVLWSYAAERPLLAVLRAARDSAPDDVACYFPLEEHETTDTSDWDIPDAASLRPTESSFFFHETTCGSADGGVRLTARQACAVESVARLHPHRTVYLLLTAATSSGYKGAYTTGYSGRGERNYTATAGWSAAARALAAYRNVRVARLAVGRYVRGTPLQRWFMDGGLASSHWPREHAADALRLVTLWRFGGTYLDLDVVAIRSLDGLRNFAGAESASAVAVGALGFARDELGRRVAAACLRELRESFRGDDWGGSGPGVITRVLQRLCQTEQVTEMSEERCLGFRVLPPAAFYPVPWSNWRQYFEEDAAAATMEAARGSYAVHVWNKKSAAANVSIDSKQAYAQFARQFCPRVVKSAGAYF